MSISSGTTTTGLTDAWRCWVATNLMSGVAGNQITEILARQGFDPDQARDYISSVQADPVYTAGKWMSERLSKLESFLDIRHDLESLTLGATLERRRDMGTDEFLARYYSANRPVHLEDVCPDWPAVERWTPEYLRMVIGDELVEVMDGRDDDRRYEVNSSAHKRLMPFTAYVDTVLATERGNNTYLVANNHLLEREAASPLWSDFQIDERYLDPRARMGAVFVWFGPGGTITPLHHDVANILFAQITGRKRVTLISPLQSHCVYNEVGVFSEVDPDNPNLGRFPRFVRAQPIQLVLGAGDALFITVGWLYHVESLETSISLTFTNFRFPNAFEWHHPSIHRD